MKEILKTKNIFLFEKYQEFYEGEDYHHHMNFDEFLNDPDIYTQINMIFYDVTNLKRWYNIKYKNKIRKNKITRLK